MSKEKLIESLQIDFSQIEKVEINKNLNGVLEIKIKERQASFWWCGSEGILDCLSMTDSGLAFARANQEEVKDKIIFRNYQKEAIILTNFASSEVMQNYAKAIEVLENNQFSVSEIILELSDKAIFKTNVGNIFLNPEEDLRVTAQNAVALINEIHYESVFVRIAKIF